MSLIWPGLDLIAKGYASHQAGRGMFCYPFRLYPPSPEFNRGEHNADLMDQVVAFIGRLRPKAHTGGRIQMDAIEIRVAILAVRVHLGWWRYRIARAGKTLRDCRRSQTATSRNRVRTIGAERKIERAKEIRQAVIEVYRDLKVRTPRVIQSLERHLKRANSRLLSDVGNECYDALMSAWRAHLRWMRLRLVYFWLPRIGPVRRKSDCQLILQELEKIARLALAEEDYVPPDAKELHRIVRLFAVSVRRGRQGIIKGIPRALQDGSVVRQAVVDFILKRTELERLPEK